MVMFNDHSGITVQIILEKIINYSYPMLGKITLNPALPPY